MLKVFLLANRRENPDLNILKNSKKWSCFLRKCAKFDQNIVLSCKKTKHGKNTVFCGGFFVKEKARVVAIFQGWSGYSKQTLFFCRPEYSSKYML